MTERPALRPGLTAIPDPTQPGFVFLLDRFFLTDRQARLSRLELDWLQLCDGTRTVRDIHADVGRSLNGQTPPLAVFERLLAQLEAAAFLDGPRYRQLLDGPIREPSCIGAYEGDPDKLRLQVERLFRAGPGLPAAGKPDGSLRAALIPHMDYQRGGLTYAWGFKELFEKTAAKLFIVIATSHYSAHRFTLTRKHFKTPLGVVPTDQQFIDRLAAEYGSGLFDDPFAHLPEHSIELEVVFLQYLYEGRPFRIVPLLVGSFHDCVAEGGNPLQRRDIARMVDALRRVEAATREPICYLISGDLAHIGPKFGDPLPVGERFLDESRQLDQEILRHTAAANPGSYFQAIADEGDRRRICGLSPTFTTLQAARPARGKVLHYDQYVHPQGHESVSFASVAFYR
ncbi:MAG: AmmeMemoRadiSam system protein B [Planctomycetia bacterium]|nr:AmmeMemoRadiSam system protein B [Planctomycetia bacterium]